jgi:hypothetical protein
MQGSVFRPMTGFVASCLVGVVGGTAATTAQSSSPASQGSDSIYAVTDFDRVAVQNSTPGHLHALPTRRPDGIRNELRVPYQSPARASANTSDPPSVQYPADLTYQGGQLVTTAEHHAIYLRPNGNCPVFTCWGNPEGFLSDLSRSNFIHITDQYVNASANDRYPVGQHAHFNITPPHNFSTGSEPYTDADMVAFVHAVASRTGQTGYGHIYHVFLPQGTDECFDTSYSVCYSPDSSSAFFFCAYHGSVDFSDIGHVLYTVEPYQNVGGCNEPPNTPNGQLADSTDSILSHEVFETITDPDGLSWWNNGGDLDLNGYEIGDECQWFEIIGTSAYFKPSFFQVGERTYAVQGEYNNNAHGCTTAP